MVNKIKILGLLSVFFCYFLIYQITYAATYDLIAPSGTLIRGQEVQFTINIDTEGQTLKNAQIGMTYQNEYLEYLSTLQGDTFPTLTTETQEGGRLIFTGTNNNGFSGRGVFAVVTFKLIANAPGSTELCVLFNPQTSPSPTTSQTNPAPTALLKVGSGEQTSIGTLVGLTFLLIASSLFFFFNLKKYSKK